ncbi:MAG: response regulator transcription factor [Armatimonadota bacterium]
MSVDDEPIVHQMLEQIVSTLSLPIRFIGSASSGEEALDLAKRIHPDIFLLDIHMEGMDGLELASRLTDILHYKPCIVYLSAYDRFEYAQKAVRLGAADYILKPINRKHLESTLRRVVNDIQAERLDHLDRERLRQRVESMMPSIVPDAQAAGENRNSAIARRVRCWVDEHYSEKLTLGAAAEQFNLSSGYIGSIFKAASGMSFRAYLRSVRIARAIELLQNPAINVSEVAQAVGYDDVNYFSQAFLDETGIRPSEYRGGGKRWAK